MHLAFATRRIDGWYVEVPFGPDIETDPVIGMTQVSHGLRPDVAGSWSKRARSDTLDGRP
jgi:hypothetical protein